MGDPLASRQATPATANGAHLVRPDNGNKSGTTIPDRPPVPRSHSGVSREDVPTLPDRGVKMAKMTNPAHPSRLRM